MGGLKDEVRYYIKLLNPKTLQQTFGMVKIQEEFVNCNKKTSKSFWYANNYVITPIKFTARALVPVHRISPT